MSVASFVSGLVQLQIENTRLEELTNSLGSQRDHLLAVNARLEIPLHQQTATPRGLIAQFFLLRKFSKLKFSHFKLLDTQHDIGPMEPLPAQQQQSFNSCKFPPGRT
jgi:hypothetical protein